MKKLFFSAVIIASIVLCIAASALNPHVYPSLCVGCGDCVRICPVEAVDMVRGKVVIDIEKCIGCKQCVFICSYGAVR